jgi:HEAT repeat protein
MRPAAAGDGLDEQIDDRLADMRTSGSAYNPKELHELGLAGLERLLDRLFPETAPTKKADAPPAAEEARRLVAQLGDEEFRIREEATRQLIAKGKRHRELLLKAADSPDAEVRLRARRILAAWMPQAGGLVEQALGGFWKYAEGIRDRERLSALARRTNLVLDRGWPEGSKVHLTRLCIAGVAKGGDDEACELLRPLLAHDDARVARLVVETIGSYKDKTFFPQLLVDALASERDETVEVAVRWSQHCHESPRAEEIRQALVRVFTNRSEALKFQCCLVLTQEFDDPAAWLFLIEQTQSKEPLRAASAQSRLAGLSYSGRPAQKELIEKLQPQLASPALARRWGAAKVLGIHAGGEIVEILIPLLADKEQSVADVARRGILSQGDKRVTRELLKDAARTHSDPAVRSAAAALSKELK